MFFKDIDDFKACGMVSAAFEFEPITVYLKDIDRTVLKKYMGKDFLDELQADFDAVEKFDDLDDGLIKDLLDLLRIASANLALVKWLPVGQVTIDSAGIRINTNENQKTAFQWQVKDIKRSFNEIAMNALDDALEVLEENISDSAFATYKDSDEFKENNYLFVPTAKEFCKLFSPMSNSRVNFLKIQSVMRKVEDFEIKRILLPSLFNDLKTKLQSGDAIGALSQTIIDMVKPAVVNLTVAAAMNDMAASFDAEGLLVFNNTAANETDGWVQAGDEAMRRIANTADRDGRTYLKILADYLETNKDSYPLYTGDGGYVAPADVTNLNTGDRPFFAAL